MSRPQRMQLAKNRAQFDRNSSSPLLLASPSNKTWRRSVLSSRRRRHCVLPSASRPLQRRTAERQTPARTSADGGAVDDEHGVEASGRTWAEQASGRERAAGCLGGGDVLARRGWTRTAPGELEAAAAVQHTSREIGERWIGTGDESDTQAVYSVRQWVFSAGIIFS